MSNTRQKGIAFLTKVMGTIAPSEIAVSKHYPADQSWTKEPTWWFDLPVDKIRRNQNKYYYLLGESEHGDFVILKVPIVFLQDNIDSFDILNEATLRLHITSEGDDIYIDKRGTGQINFSGFLQEL